MHLDSRRGTILVGAGVLALLGANAFLGRVGGEVAPRVASLIGIAFLLGLALLMSEDRSRIPVRTVLVGLGLQLALGLVVLKTGAGEAFFDAIGVVFRKVRLAGLRATKTLLWNITPEEPFDDPANPVMLAIELVTIIVFVGALSRILYHLGIMQRMVRGMAWMMRRLMRTSGAESLSAASNVFVGMVEAPLTIRPYVAGLTRSELFCVMSAGMATIAGSVMVIYTNMLERGGIIANPAGHLLTASIMSAPAAILIAKIMVPETGEPATRDADAVPRIDEGETRPVNAMDAAARGALEGLQLALAVIGMLIAFMALVHLANIILGAVSAPFVEKPEDALSFQKLAGWCFSPVAVGMGVPWADAVEAGSLMGTKTVLNEYMAYIDLSGLKGEITAHTARVMSYALCGFANLGSVAIMIAGIGGIAPNQRPSLAKLGLWSIVSGSLAAFMTGCLAGLLG